MAAVRGFTVRIKMIAAKGDFPDLCQLCHTLMDPYFEAFERVRSSSRLRTLLALILYVGNYVNQENSRNGNAPGFHIEYITSIKPLRGSEPGSSMLSFLVGVLSSQFPDTMHVLSDLAVIGTVRGMKFSDAEEKVAELARHVEGITSLVEKYQFMAGNDSGAVEDVEEDAFMRTSKICQDCPHLSLIINLFTRSW